MARHRKKKLKVKSNGCVGVILTQWKTSHIGAIAGLQFTAELAIGSGETTVTYIVRTFDLDDPDDGKWHGMSSAEERDEFIRKDAMKERPARLN